MLLTIAGVSERAGRLQSMPNGSRTLTFGDRQQTIATIVVNDEISVQEEAIHPTLNYAPLHAAGNGSALHGTFMLDATSEDSLQTPQIWTSGPGAFAHWKHQPDPRLAMLEEFRKWKQNCNSLDFYYSILLMKKSCTTWDV